MLNQSQGKPMNQTQIEEVRQRLLRLQDDLQHLQASTEDPARPIELDQCAVERLSRIDALQNQQIAQHTARRRQQQQTQIEGTLRRLESGDFGFCAVCDQEIDIRRLQADPTKTRSIECANT